MNFEPLYIMSISVKNISKTYGTQKVLSDVSFNIKKGEIVGFLGPNGAGKSTMMKILTGYVPADSGIAEICGLNITDFPLETKQMIGYLPEHNPLYLEMYVKEYLEFVAQLYGLGKQTKNRIHEMIEKTGLTLEYRKKIGQLSKGYRQRVGLAQALIHNPDVLILDEPTTGLDPNQLLEVRNLIAEIGREKTVMLSTHIMQEVSAICERVMIINRGEIVANEAGKDILKISSKKTIRLTVEFDKPVAEKELAAIPAVLTVRAANPASFVLESDTDIRSDIFRFATEKGLTLLTLNQEQQSMEDLFYELTQAGK